MNEFTAETAFLNKIRIFHNKVVS